MPFIHLVYISTPEMGFPELPGWTKVPSNYSWCLLNEQTDLSLFSFRCHWSPWRCIRHEAESIQGISIYKYAIHFSLFRQGSGSLFAILVR